MRRWLFETSKKPFFLPTEHSEAVGLIALESWGWWKLWVQKVIRQTHSRKIWINTKTPLLAQEASELQFVRGQERTVGTCPFVLALSLRSSLNICYCLAPVRSRHWTLLWAEQLSWVSEITQMWRDRDHGELGKGAAAQVIDCRAG